MSDNRDNFEINPVVRKPKDMSRSSFYVTSFTFNFIILPTLISLLYSVAILFPPGARHNAPLFLWTNGELTKSEEGKVVLCPPGREAICSEGGIQIFLMYLSRSTAFASYSMMGAVFLSKMHFSLHWLTSTSANTFIPFQRLHKIHKKIGSLYFLLALLHVVGHLIRFSIRQEMIARANTKVGISGFIGISALIIVVFSMSTWAKALVKAERCSSNKFFSWLTFERRFKYHWLSFILLTTALCFHSRRSRMITLIFIGLWVVDYLYGFFFRTFRLDVAAITPLPGDAGVQILWRNPKGFIAKSGEYVQIKLPWLSKGGNEWHAFSIYSHEATNEGLKDIMRKQKKEKLGLALMGPEALAAIETYPKKTALLLIGYENEIPSERIKIHDIVKRIMDETSMAEKIKQLVKATRDAGANVIHIPIISNEYDHDTFFTWNTLKAELEPSIFNILGTEGQGLDTSFRTTDLQDFLEERCIETLIIGGFLTNCCVECTIRKAYEKGYNIITLVDGIVCNSQKEQEAIINGTFNSFSTPMTCEKAKRALEGGIQTNHNVNGLKKKTSLFEIEPEPQNLEEFIVSALIRRRKRNEALGPSLILSEARKDINSLYETTQVFIVPSGDWTNRVSKEIRHQDQLRSCWVRGPYTSPYHVAPSFKHLVLVATGIGITPALGVIGQYPGSSPSKFLIWAVRSREMLIFFAPLLQDTHISIVFYTGQEPLTANDLRKVCSYGEVFVKHSRPKSIIEAIESVIVTFENQSESLTSSGESFEDKNGENQNSIDNIDENNLRAWCMLYCGSFLEVKDEMKQYGRKKGIRFESELFDW